MLFKIFRNQIRTSLHFLCRELLLGVAEIQVVAVVQRHEVDMGVRDVQAQHGYAHPLAGNALADGFGNSLGKHHQACQFFVREVEDVIRFLFRYNQRMPFLQRIDVQKSIVTLVLRYLVGRNLAVHDF